MRIAALPVDKFPKKGSSALSVFADTVISEPGIRAVLENSAPSFYAAVTKNLAEDSKTERTKVLKVARSALKYLSRLTTRATPFSTFATVGVLENVVSNPDGLELEVGQRRILERIAEGLMTLKRPSHLTHPLIFLVNGFTFHHHQRAKRRFLFVTAKPYKL